MEAKAKPNPKGVFRKIYVCIWNDKKFCELTDRGKLVFLFILTHPGMTSLGAMRATMGGLASELGWTEKAFGEAFGEALAKGMVKHDDKAHFVSAPHFLNYNRPESPNVVKSWVKCLPFIPECQLKVQLLQDVKAFAEGLPEAFAEGFAIAFREAFPKGMPNQEQEQEQEQNIPPTPKGGDASPPEEDEEKIPETLDTPEFRLAWNDWIADKKDRKEKLTPRARKMQLERLGKFDVPTAIAMIQQSITNAWKGIFELKADRGGNGQGVHDPGEERDWTGTKLKDRFMA